MENVYVIDSEGKKRKAVEINCDYCGVLFAKPRRFLKRSKHHYCSGECLSESRRNRIEVTCAWCGNIVEKKPSSLSKSKSGLYFCDRSCKEEAQRLGGLEEIQPDHYGQRDRNQDCSLSEFAESLNDWRIRIREYARIIVFDIENRPKRCVVCGYDRYVEVCHITPISEFDDTVFVSTINDPINLVVLCPNHHKELDLGVLNLGAVV